MRFRNRNNSLFAFSTPSARKSLLLGPRLICADRSVIPGVSTPGNLLRNDVRRKVQFLYTHKQMFPGVRMPFLAVRYYSFVLEDDNPVNL